MSCRTRSCSDSRTVVAAETICKPPGPIPYLTRGQAKPQHVRSPSRVESSTLLDIKDDPVLFPNPTEGIVVKAGSRRARPTGRVHSMEGTDTCPDYWLAHGPQPAEMPWVTHVAVIGSPRRRGRADGCPRHGRSDVASARRQKGRSRTISHRPCGPSRCARYGPRRTRAFRAPTLERPSSPPLLAQRRSWSRGPCSIQSCVARMLRSS